MTYGRQRIAYSFGPGLSPLGKRLLMIYAVIYVAELLLEHWFRIPAVSMLQLHPLGSEGFRIWQPFTSPFIHDPYSPVGFLIDCLVFYFFSSSVESALGSRRFLTLFYTAAGGGALCGMAFSYVSGFSAPFGGMMPSLLTLVALFGLLNPDATILMMFILPVKAIYITYFTVAVTFLTFLAKVNPYGAYHLGGMLFGYLYFAGPKNLTDFHFFYLKYQHWRYERAKKARFSKFRVIDGKQKKRDKDGPTIH